MDEDRYLKISVYNIFYYTAVVYEVTALFNCTTQKHTQQSFHSSLMQQLAVTQRPKVKICELFFRTFNILQETYMRTLCKDKRKLSKPLPRVKYSSFLTTIYWSGLRWSQSQPGNTGEKAGTH